MNEQRVTLYGDFIRPDQADFEGTLSFCFKTGYLEKSKLWKSKDLSAEFMGHFWENLLDMGSIRPRLHFICAELLENAVYHSPSSDYMVLIQLYFKASELLIFVENSVEPDRIGEFRAYIENLLAADDLQALFIRRMKAARRSGSRKSQVGLITIMKDRGARLSWRVAEGPDAVRVTTLARLRLETDPKENGGAS